MDVKTRLLALIISLALNCLSFASYAEDQQGEENLLKAVFIYNFAKFTRWPDEVWDKSEPSVQICYIGFDDLTKALVRLHGRRLREYPVKIVQKENTSQLDTCHVLYLANTLIWETLHITDLIRSKPILTVSELPGFAEYGGMIELYQNDGRIRFKVNLQITRKAGLDLSSRLLKLATIVDKQ